MLSKPIVGLNADYQQADGASPAISYVTAGYYDAIHLAGGIPVVTPPLECEADISALLERLDAFVLIGGADLDPKRDGFMRHPSVRPMASRRETFDRTLARLIGERHLPVLGVGAGMQLLNLSQGGNLHLHIPEDVPTALPHKDSQDRGHRHGLEIERDSLMERVYGEGEIRVNSMHHMAVDEIAPGFRVTARCPDGIVEAIESCIEGWLAIGTQFHPEASSASALDQRIFEEFLSGVDALATPMRMVA